MAANIELTAVYCRERIRWDDTVIIDCDPADKPTPAIAPYPDTSFVDDFQPSLTIKTTAELDELQPGLSYRFYGHWTSYKNRRTGDEERQFLARTWVKVEPHSKAGILKYLLHAPNIGTARANILWQHFGSDAVKVLRETPEKAVGLSSGMSLAKMKEAAEYLETERAMEDCSIELIDVLSGRGFPRDTGKKAVKEWGNQSARLIRQNPYLLMRFRGCGFLRTDALYLELGGNPAKLKRQALCMWHTLATDTEGHTWFSTGVVENGLRAKIGGATVQAIAAAKLAKRAGMIQVRQDSGRIWVAEGRRAKHESYIAQRVAEMLSQPTPQVWWPGVSELDVSDHQREQLAQALKAQVSLFGGSPGTGKTYSLARVVGAVIDEHGEDNVCIAAPTGKAAVRITELLQGYGITLRARTMHSHLGVSSQSAGEGWGFVHDEEHPMDYGFYFVDEASMVDTNLMSAWLAAIPKGGHLLLVGDVNQLPPVGHGAPLRDLIAAGVPYGELREIRRNSGTIVKACAQIRDGQRFQTAPQLAPDAGHNLVITETANNAATAQKIVDMLRGIRLKGFVDPVWECQVIVAVNAKSELSRKDLNKILQAELNPAGKTVKGCPFREGDKIVNLKNGFFPLEGSTGFSVEDEETQTNEKGEAFVANGELAKVEKVADKFVVASLSAPKRIIVIPRGKQDGKDGETEDDAATSTGCSWDLGYAISCHKSQGSEWPVVIVAVDEYPGARMICSREWIYTAISRAKKACILVGKQHVAQGFCRNVALGKRKTFLKELIQEAISNGRTQIQPGGDQGIHQRLEHVSDGNGSGDHAPHVGEELPVDGGQTAEAGLFA
jgi:exodeoxyribonuclease V alpha subunit